MTSRSDRQRKATLLAIRDRAAQRQGERLYAGTVSWHYVDNGHPKTVSLPLVRWLDSCRP